jgi:hypothetical protein
MPKLAVGCFLATLVFISGGVSPAPAAPAERHLAARSRPHVTVHPRRIEPGPNSKRHCVSWLQKQYRVSGTVIVPQMRCWWD